MEITKIVQSVNKKLAGEVLIYSELEVYLDAVIDEINAKLNSSFPVFSEFNNTDHIDVYPNYNFFPEKYIRTVVIPGTAAKFYIQDAEGMATAPQFDMEYATALFLMERDYLNLVPELYQVTEEQGVLGITELDQDRGLEIYGEFNEI